jgi:para-aminobenzoate synthetase
MKVLIVDNYDSFTHNLFQYVAELSGSEPTVLRNDELPWENVDYTAYEAIIISPGPGRPEVRSDLGISQSAILQRHKPVLGVCLGHQGIGYLFGARIIHAPSPFHGRVSAIYHQSRGIFAHIPNPVRVARYHSLIVDSDSLSADLMADAHTNDGLLMALSHRTLPLWGVQFHPESVATQYGKQMIDNFLRFANGWSNSERKCTALSPLVGTPV